VEVVRCHACGLIVVVGHRAVTVTADDGQGVHVYVFHPACWDRLLKLRW
jgi:hypothetical protein